MKIAEGAKISHDGDTWTIIGTGVIREDGKTFCHLASTTRSMSQKNGSMPIQIGDWIDLRDPITSYYDDRNKSGLAALYRR